MFENRVQFGLDNFIREDYFLKMTHACHLTEETNEGRSDLYVTIAGENLCAFNFDDTPNLKKSGKQTKHPKCGFVREEKKYGMTKCVDHLIFEKAEEGWLLHLFEMKTSVGYNTWLESIKPKVRTSYLTGLAIGQYLGIEIRKCIAYTTYETEKFESIAQTVNGKAFFPPLGTIARDPYRDEWKKGRMILNMGDELELEHVCIKMNRNASTGVLEGSIAI